MKGSLSTEGGGANQGSDFRKIVHILLSTWPWFLISIITVQSITALYLRYASKEYKVNALIQVQDSKRGADLPDGALLEQLGIGNKSNVENEVDIFKSRSLVERVVDELQLYARVYSRGRIKLLERYNDRPFQIKFVTLNVDSLEKNHSYDVHFVGKTGFELSNDNKIISRGKWNDTLVLPVGIAVMSRNDVILGENISDFVITVEHPERVILRLMENLEVEIPNKQGSTIKLSLSTPLPKQGEDIINKLIDVYLQSNVDDKNRMALNTMEFIDERLGLVEKELSGIEREIEGFKVSTGFMDLTTQSKELVTNASEYDKKIAQSEIQLDIIEGLEKSINENKTVPTSLAIADPLFKEQIESYNSLQLEKERLLMSSTKNNPAVKNLEVRLLSMRNGIKSSISGLKKEAEINIRQLNRKNYDLNGEMNKVPFKERVYLEKSRQQIIKQELYLFLLKKREETAISLASNIANARIIDIGKSSIIPFKPKKSVIYLVAFLVAIIIPGAIIYFKELMNVRISKKSDITGRTDIPIIGRISKNNGQEQIVSNLGSRTVISEEFRSLRTNIQFLVGGEQNIILVTSSMSGEGKSFVSLNLASILAASGKKVALMEMDLRKPKISSALSLDSRFGFSNYIIGKAEFEQILVATNISENLWVVPSGPLPPNPSELILQPNVGDLFKRLKEKFDYVIVDTAPVGLVTDAQILATHVHATLFLVRHGYTYKQQLLDLQELNLEKKFPKIGIVYNDVVFSKGASYGYGYGYGYGNGYGYGYDEDVSEMNPKQTILNKFRNKMSKSS